MNIPDGNLKKAGQLEERVGDFWEAYNKAFLEMIIQNKGKVNVVLVSDPRKKQVLFKYSMDVKDYIADRTYFYQELIFLRENNIDAVSYLGREAISLKTIQ